MVCTSAAGCFKLRGARRQAVDLRQKRCRKMSADPRGVLRGQCTAAVCPCDGYTRDSAGGAKCGTCGHPPAKHVNLSVTANAGPQPTKGPSVLSPPPHTAIRRSLSPGPRLPVSAIDTAQSPVPVLRRCKTPEPRNGPAPLQLSPGTAFAPRCRIPGCTNVTFFDPNSGDGYPCCRSHMDVQYHNLPAPFSGMYVTDGNSDPAMLPQQTQYAPAPTKALLWQPPVGQPAPPLSPPTQLTPHMQLPHSPPTQQIPPPSLPDHLRCKFPQCNRPRYKEPNGKTHEFCGRTHAREYEKLNHAEPTVASDMQCKTPQCTRPRRRMDDGKGYYDFCSLSCRNRGNQISSSSETCSLPGCNRPKYRDPANGRVHDFCGRTHAKQAQAKGIAVKQCSLTKLQPGSQDFSQVQSFFQKNWAQKKGACPAISCVFLVRNAQLETRWKQYQTTLPVQTIEPYYHGTKLTCDIMTKCTACNDSDCGICGISQMGMDRRCIQKNINFQRFGHGFYFAPNSSKCHDYTQGVQKHRAMLQCDILPGKKHTRKRGDKDLKDPPPGCHSVHGQRGGELNYEELVVYNPDCVMPRYIIVYEKDGVHKIAK